MEKKDLAQLALMGVLLGMGSAGSLQAHAGHGSAGETVLAAKCGAKCGNSLVAASCGGASSCGSPQNPKQPQNQEPAKPAAPQDSKPVPSEQGAYTYPSPAKGLRVIADASAETMQSTQNGSTARGTKATPSCGANKQNGSAQGNQPASNCGANKQNGSMQGKQSGGSCGHVVAENATMEKVKSAVESKKVDVTAEPMKEEDLLAKLDTQGKALYNSLDADGKALARKLAGVVGASAYANKNMAVKAAAQQIAAKKAAGAPMPAKPNASK
jgi:hypothetical protein